MHDTTAQMIARRAANLNLDALLEVFLESDDTSEIRRHLQHIYCFVINKMGQSEDIITEEVASGLFLIQRIFEAVDDMNVPSIRLLKVEAMS